MKAILSLISAQAIITYLLRLLHGITAEQWAAAVQHVISASKAFVKSEDKAAWVKDALSEFKLSDKALNVLLELAVSYAVSKGLTAAKEGA